MTTDHTADPKRLEAVSIAVSDGMELSMQVAALGQEGFRIIAVIKVHPDDFLTHIVAQKDPIA